MANLLFFFDTNEEFFVTCVLIYGMDFNYCYAPVMKRLFNLLILTSISFCAWCQTSIFGSPQVDIETMYRFVSARNPDFVRDVAETFYTVGERYGIRGDIALCQAIIETGWFRFDNGTAVKPDSHNYCGLGVRKRGDKGCKFDSVEEGITAMIQHLYAYACNDKLPKGEKIVDPRFSYVKRGCAPSWESLAGRWAMNPRYGKSILRIYESMLNHEPVDKTIELIEVLIPDDILLSAENEDDSPENSQYFD